MTTLTRDLADGFASLALSHVSREYPNKLDHVLAGPEDVAGPRALHPVFFGSFDWHSCVHGFWLLTRALRRFPDLPSGPRIEALFAERITPDERRRRGRLPRPTGVEGLRATVRVGVAAGAAGGAGPGSRQRGAPGSRHPPAARRRIRGAVRGVPAPGGLPGAGRRAHQHGVRPAARRGRRRGAAPGPLRPDAGAGDRLVRGGPRRAGLGAQRRRLPLADARGGRVHAAVHRAGRVPGVVRNVPAAGGVLATRRRCSSRRGSRTGATARSPTSTVSICRGPGAGGRSRVHSSRATRGAERFEAVAAAHLAASLPHVAGDYMGEHWLATFAMLALEGA